MEGERTLRRERETDRQPYVIENGIYIQTHTHYNPRYTLGLRLSLPTICSTFKTRSKLQNFEASRVTLCVEEKNLSSRANTLTPWQMIITVACKKLVALSRVDIVTSIIT